MGHSDGTDVSDESKISLPCRESEALSLDYPAQGLITTILSYPSFHKG